MKRFAVMTFMHAGWANSEAGSHEELIQILSDAGADGIEAYEDFVPSPRLICSSADCLHIMERTDERVKFGFDTGNFEAVSECTGTDEPGVSRLGGARVLSTGRPRPRVKSLPLK